MRRLRFSDLAEADLDANALYLESRRRGTSRKFLRAVNSTLRRLMASPESVARYGFRDRAIEDVRVCAVERFRNWVVLFSVGPDAVTVLRVLHGTQDLDSMTTDDLLGEGG